MRFPRGGVSNWGEGARLLCPWVPFDELEKFPTLGFTVADWMSEYLLQPETDTGAPFIPTQEQLEFLVNMYRLDPATGRRLVSSAVLSRPRGWGKSPFLAAIGAAEAMGPVLFDGWDANGQPVGVPWLERLTPRVVICATTEAQTLNTWFPLLEMLRGLNAEAEYGVDPMETFIALRRGRIERYTLSATSVKGLPIVAAIADQTETWLPGNRGPALMQVLRANTAKRGGVVVESPNAYIIGQNSVAEETAKHWARVEAGEIKDEAATAVLYDHRGAPYETDLTSRDSLIEGLRIAYGDLSAHPSGCVLHSPPCEPGWVDLERIAQDFWLTYNDPASMCADFLNQINAATNAWLTQPEVRAISDPTKTITSREPVTLGFDGSEGRRVGIADSTVLMGYSLTQKHFFNLGIWSQPDGPAGEGWVPPRVEIEQAVAEAFKKYNVVGFYADPSAGWAGDVKEWEAAYLSRLKARINQNEPIRYPQRNVSQTCENFAQLLTEIRAGTVTYDGLAQVSAHLLNARKSPRRNGYVIEKPVTDQDYSKVDACWAMMFAYKAGLDATGRGVLKQSRARLPRRLY